MSAPTPPPPPGGWGPPQGPPPPARPSRPWTRHPVRWSIIGVIVLILIISTAVNAGKKHHPSNAGAPSALPTAASSSSTPTPAPSSSASRSAYAIPTAADLYRADGSHGSEAVYAKLLALLQARCEYGSRIALLIDKGAEMSHMTRLKLMQNTLPGTRKGAQINCIGALVAAENGISNVVPSRYSMPPPTTAAAPPAQPSSAPAGCYPKTDGGNCYEPGEFCRDSDHGDTGVAGDGKSIACEDNNGWRWEPQ